MGIYNRDNINYSGMIQNMLASAKHGGEIRANNIRSQGDIWGGAVKNVGSAVGRAYGMYGGNGGMSEDEIELQKLEKEREELLKQQEAAEHASAVMADYRQNVPNYTGVMGQGNPYAIPGNPYATQAEYFQYIQAMNGIYGGR